MAKPHLAPVSPRGELEPAQRVDRHRVRLNGVDVAEDDGPRSSAEERADTVAEAGKVGRGDRASNPEADSLWRCGAHWS